MTGNSDANYDAIVVGSRCAGAPTAMLLARSGHRVLLVDRAGMPSDTLSTHNLVQPGVVMMQRWGLLDRLVETGCPAATTTRMTFDGTTFEVPIQDLAGVGTTFAPRRFVIDALLTSAARDAGAEVRLGVSVRNLLSRHGRVAGVCLVDRDGHATTATAPVVIGADGAHSFVARSVGARVYNARPTDSCVYFAYWRGVPERATVEIARVPGRAMAIFPTHDDDACVLVARPANEWADFRRAPEQEYLATLASVPAFAQRVLQGRRVSRFFGTADLPNFFREASGPGWALVGDAGYVKDPTPGRGMSDAFRQADRLAAAVHDGLRGDVAMDDALAAFGAWRDATFAGVFETTVEIARLDTAPDEAGQHFLRHQRAVAAEHAAMALEAS